MGVRVRAAPEMVGTVCLVLLASMYAPPAASLAPTSGVPPDQQALYAGPEFSCKDGSGKIAIAQVKLQGWVRRWGWRRTGTRGAMPPGSTRQHPPHSAACSISRCFPDLFVRHHRLHEMD